MGWKLKGESLLQGAEVDSLTDHRIAMGLAIAALGSQGSTVINRAEAAAISYPEFFDTLGKISQG